MRIVLTILLSVLIVGSVPAVTLDSIIIEVLPQTNGGYDGGFPLSSPHRGQYTALAQDKMTVRWGYGGGSYNLFLYDSTNSCVDSLNVSSIFGETGVDEHAHIVCRNDTLYISQQDPGQSSPHMLMVPVASGMFGTYTYRNPTLYAGATVYATRWHPQITGDSSVVIWRVTDPRTYDVSYNWSNDYMATVGTRGFVADVGDEGRLGACWYDSSVLAGVYNRDDDFVVSYWNRATQAWVIDTVFGPGVNDFQRWFDLQSINDTTMYVTMPVSTGTIDTLRYAAKHKGDASWTYGDLMNTGIGDYAQSTDLCRIESSGRMVAFYVYRYSSGNDGIRMRWASPTDSLQFSTTEYIIMGDSINLSGSLVQNRMTVSPIVPSGHGDVAYVLRTDPSTSSYRVIKVTFVPVAEGEENYRPTTIVGGGVSGGVIW